MDSCPLRTYLEAGTGCRCTPPGRQCRAGDPPIETLARQDTEFRLGHIQPTAVLGRVVPLEPLDEATCLGGWKGLIE
jgi:hypothetical protein